MSEEQKLAEKIRILTQTRKLTIAALNRFTGYVHSFSNTDKIYELQARTEKIHLLWNEFAGIQGDLEIFDIQNDHSGYRVDFEDEFFGSTGEAKRIIDKHFSDLAKQSRSQSSPAVVQQTNSANNTNLPKVKLPEFYGSYENWLQFSDTYKSLVHNSNNITKIEKFFYLKSCLKGDAANVLSSLEVCEANYDVAWDILCNRYQNKRAIIQTHMKAFFELNLIQKDSHVSMRNLIDSSTQHLRALESLGVPVQSWDVFVIYHLSSRLDPVTRKEWETFSLTLPTDTPSVSEFTSFLNKHCQVLENIGSIRPTTQNKFVHKNQKSSNFAITNTQTLISCILCKGDHQIYNCQQLLKLSPQERLNKIRKLSACTNCLRQGHFSKYCKSTSACKLCNLRHNSLLHLPKSNVHEQGNDNNSSNVNINNPDGSSDKLPESSKALSVTNVTNSVDREPYILLSTANILVADLSGKYHTCRALLDNCSQSNFITKKFFEGLNLPSERISHSVQGFGNSLSKIFTKTSLNLKSSINNFSATNVSFLIADQITKNLPDISFSLASLKIPQNLVLADSKFNETGPIDMLIGTAVFWNLLCVGQIILNQNTILQKTKLGWIVSGPLPVKLPTYSLCNLSIDNSTLHDQLEKFWKIEECHPKSLNTKEENECEEQFLETTTHDIVSGRFIVTLPLKENICDLGSSYDAALKRFLNTEKRLYQNPELRKLYNDFMLEYITLGHMTKIDSGSLINQNSISQEFFLPHHGVLKESSTTTKLRVVFDGSAKTTTGLSLNDTLKVGPKLQDDLMDIVIRFRTYKFAFTADIEKMYRCVIVRDNQRNLQKILWRFNNSDKVDQYQLNTVTYGTASAAYLAVRCLQQVALENKHKFSKACEIILTCFYVDDLLTGCNSVEEGKTLISEIIEVLASAGFNLRKFVSNEESILSCLSSNNNENNAPKKIISNDKTIKTLGLTWDSVEDVFLYTVNISQNPTRVTKRQILAITAQIFDPMGLIGPCIILAKLILQQLWQLGIDWDESVPQSIHDTWTKFCAQIPIINSIKIPRLILCSEPLVIELHGFSDASERAYGACCYVRSISRSGEIFINLVCAKSRVAPLKSLTLPRLELSAAHLLAQLAQRVLTSLNLNIDKIFFWSDSTIVLSWLSLQPKQLNTFVANRVSEIQQFSKDHKWLHVSSENNPADVISRGLEPKLLGDCHIWWHGPHFLSTLEEFWPNNNTVFLDPPEMKQNNVSLVTTSTNKVLPIENYSSLSKLQRIVAYVIRFVHNCQSKVHVPQFGPLKYSEFNKALIYLCKQVQSQHFLNDLKSLRVSKSLNSKSPLLRLNPFLDDDGLIRVGGRLRNSHLSFNAKHPILLPSDSHLTKLIIFFEHSRHLHAGAHATLSAVRLRFWPINGLNIVKKILRNCIKCFKVNPSPLSYQMSSLPRSRVVPQRPFAIAGVDFAGPFMVKDGKTKNRILVKCYLCIFVCFTTKATHLELAGDLSTEAFLNCLKRFVSRRGLCSDIHSDNGTNFIGAFNEIKSILKNIKNDSQFHEYLETNQITWHFTPPYSPNFGGLWESSVKSAKFHMKRIIGNSHLTYESLSTVFTQIEAVLNSRPLLPLSSDPNDLNVLTPSHFLIGDVLTSLPQNDVKNIPENRLTHFKNLQRQTQHFWQRWSTSYLTTLQERAKWCKSFPNLCVGTLVLIKEDNSAPLYWKTGRVVKVFPGNDDIVRVVELKTNAGIVKRSVTKLCALPVEV